MEETVKKKGFFRDFIKSIKNFEKYEDFALEGIKGSLKYILKLIILFCIILSIVFSYVIVKNINDMYQDLKNTAPNFTFKDNTLNVESNESILIEKYNRFLGTILIDTTEEANEEECIDTMNHYNKGIILLKNEMIVINNSNHSKMKAKYSDFAKSIHQQFAEENIEIESKEDAIDKIQQINIFSLAGAVFFTFFLSNIIVYVANFLLYALVLTLLAFLIARISKMKMNFANSFGIATHALTLSIILNLIYIILNSLTGFEIKYFDWMYNTIAYIYVIVAILMIKTDFIDRQMQLLKIAEVQKEIKKEENKDEENEKKPVEKDNKEKKKKEEEEENEDGQDSLHGSEA